MDVVPGEALAAVGFGAVVSPFVRVEGGLDNQMWRFATVDGREHVLRIYRAGNEGGMRREREAIAAAGGAGLPVPTFEASSVWRDRPLAVLPWLPGRPMLQAVRSPLALWRLGKSFGAVQAAIHAVPPPETLRSVPPDAWLERCGPEHGAIAAAVRARGVATDRLVHLDYHPLNVLTQGSRVTAVLDWVNAAAGDPRVDLAQTATLLTVAPVPAGTPRPILRALRGALRRAWWQGYTGVAGPVRLPPAFMAWAGARLLHDLERHAGEPDSWTDAHDLEPLRSWVRRWSSRAGIAAR